MSAIQLIQRPVFRAPTKGRDYLTARAAANAEAGAMLARKYPTERAAYENGMCYDPGYHWSGDERLVRVHARLSKRIMARFRAAAAIDAQRRET
ncbi:hypothetical protein EJP67_18395 [Variovorax guangxiensis]|uniref:Uncharacterized protein n=1 Tax=Variovorax guangxiensis TaxID=1775474 RepID=A0A3S0XG04_9BURK|nr:hypothetical protein [Variovorax guangxiensis]RUR69031.1 hypothetical protein EJP67_18395 [Variovorax guangxiensis]